MVNAVRLLSAGSRLARAVPAPVATGAALTLGAVAAPLGGARREQVVRNLRRVHGPGFGGRPLRRAVRQTFQSYARYWEESFRLPGMTAAQLDAGLTTEGWPLIEEGLERGRGAIVALPHLGAWEWAGFWAAEVKKAPVSVVVEALEPVEVFEWFRDLREALGMHVIPLGPDAGAEVVRALQANHIVCLLSDRAISSGGVEVSFFGERTLLPAGPATLALRTGAPLLPISVYFRGPGRHGVVRRPVPAERAGRLRDDVVRVTQLLAHELEELICAAPEQWHLMQPNWPSDPGYRIAAPGRAEQAGRH